MYLTDSAVIVFDIASKSRYDEMAQERAEADIATWRELGSVVNEYDTTDREGNPLRVVFQIDPKRLDDQGGVYEFSFPAKA